MFSSFIQVIILGLILTLVFRDALPVLVSAWALWNVWLFTRNFYKAAFGPKDKVEEP